MGEAMIELSSERELFFADTLTKAYGGDALNTAVAARRLGSSVGFLSRFGKDPFAAHIWEAIRHEGIDTQGIKVVPGFTGLYIVSVQENGERDFQYYRHGSAASTLCESDIHPGLFRDVKIFYATGITQAISNSSRRAVLKAFRVAQEMGVLTAYDPNYRRALWDGMKDALDAMDEVLPYVDIIFPTLPDDTMPLVGLERTIQVMEYFWHKEVKLVVGKAGAEGCYIGYKGDIGRVPALSVTPLDSTGTGDAFNGAFLHGLAQELPLLECAQLGITMAGLKLERRGAIRGLPTREAVYTTAFPEGQTVS